MGTPKSYLHNKASATQLDPTQIQRSHFLTWLVKQRELVVDLGGSHVVFSFLKKEKLEGK